jgi:hypothetical protein
MPKHVVRLRAVGEALHRRIAAEVSVEADGPGVERVRRTVDRLNAVRSAAAIDAIVVDLEEPIAFSVPGGSVYVSSGLLSWELGDAELAFVIAHEMAHRDLGHCDLPAEELAAIETYVAGSGEMSPLVARMIRRLHFSQRQERSADWRAVELCAAAGDDGLTAAMDYLDTLKHLHPDQGPGYPRSGLERPGDAAQELSMVRMFSSCFQISASSRFMATASAPGFRRRRWSTCRSIRRRRWPSRARSSGSFAPAARCWAAAPRCSSRRCCGTATRSR